MQLRYRIVSFLALGVLVLDQITKLWVAATLPLWSSKPVIPGFFNLVHVMNKGAAFGFLHDLDVAWRPYFFMAVTALAVVLILHLLRTVPREDKVLFTALGLILGGALGNLVDRIRLGEVIDFLDFYIGQYHWPAFNVADVAISIGSVLLLVSVYRTRRYGLADDK
ncbi:signal peptidase II [Desulfonatronum thiosulfatophilum]|uniref:Lipoprotein signal peptidase n=1 Tax=Desulfonatronum thiosulfatophilum TaxID=617002 RepID=A0A1G6EMC2_9BACT|nr:signal peptidase II [Desulfonatronum thiosulfatophilum]SDB58422.1 signal peptidase II [Desulfonatronum thiosulfatophilum]